MRHDGWPLREKSRDGSKVTYTTPRQIVPQAYPCLPLLIGRARRATGLHAASPYMSVMLSSSSFWLDDRSPHTYLVDMVRKKKKVLRCHASRRDTPSSRDVVPVPPDHLRRSRTLQMLSRSFQSQVDIPYPYPWPAARSLGQNMPPTVMLISSLGS